MDKPPQDALVAEAAVPLCCTVRRCGVLRDIEDGDVRHDICNSRCSNVELVLRLFFWRLPKSWYCACLLFPCPPTPCTGTFRLKRSGEHGHEISHRVFFSNSVSPSHARTISAIRRSSPVYVLPIAARPPRLTLPESREFIP